MTAVIKEHLSKVDYWLWLWKQLQK